MTNNLLGLFKKLNRRFAITCSGVSSETRFTHPDYFFHCLCQSARLRGGDYAYSYFGDTFGVPKLALDNALLQCSRIDRSSSSLKAPTSGAIPASLQGVGNPHLPLSFKPSGLRSTESIFGTPASLATGGSDADLEDTSSIQSSYEDSSNYQINANDGPDSPVSQPLSSEHSDTASASRSANPDRDEFNAVDSDEPTGDSRGGVRSDHDNTDGSVDRDEVPSNDNGDTDEPSDNNSNEVSVDQGEEFSDVPTSNDDADSFDQQPDESPDNDSSTDESVGQSGEPSVNGGDTAGYIAPGDEPSDGGNNAEDSTTTLEGPYDGGDDTENSIISGNSPFGNDVDAHVTGVREEDYSADDDDGTQDSAGSEQETFGETGNEDAVDQNENYPDGNDGSGYDGPRSASLEYSQYASWNDHRMTGGSPYSDVQELAGDSHFWDTPSGTREPVRGSGFLARPSNAQKAAQRLDSFHEISDDREPDQWSDFVDPDEPSEDGEPSHQPGLSDEPSDNEELVQQPAPSNELVGEGGPSRESDFDDEITNDEGPVQLFELSDKPSDDREPAHQSGFSDETLDGQEQVRNSGPTSKPSDNQEPARDSRALHDKQIPSIEGLIGDQFVDGESDEEEARSYYEGLLGLLRRAVGNKRKAPVPGPSVPQVPPRKFPKIPGHTHHVNSDNDEGEE